MANRKEKAAITRQKLIDAARKMMSTRPITEVTVEDITETAGVAKGTFYVYFDSKADVLHEIELNVMEGLLRYSVGYSDSTEQRILFYMRLYLKLMVDLSLDLYKNVIKLELDRPEETLFQKNKAAIKKILINDGYANDEKTNQAVDYISAFLHGVAVEWAISDGATKPDAVVVGYGETLIRNVISSLNK